MEENAKIEDLLDQVDLLEHKCKCLEEEKARLNNSFHVWFRNGLRNRLNGYSWNAPLWKDDDSWLDLYRDWKNGEYSKTPGTKMPLVCDPLTKEEKVRFAPPSPRNQRSYYIHKYIVLTALLIGLTWRYFSN